MKIVDPAIIKGYHAHVYFDADTIELAKELCREVNAVFDVSVGRMHEKYVGPHPRWSCQLSLMVDDFPTVIPWLALNRDGLTIFTHPDTGEHLEDHRDRAIWMGEMLELDLSIF